MYFQGFSIKTKDTLLPVVVLKENLIIKEQ